VLSALMQASPAGRALERGCVPYLPALGTAAAMDSGAIPREHE
jgi:hypothetical protein